MAADESYVRCVRHAIAIAGSPEALAASLGVERSVVEGWSAGGSAPAAMHLSRIADIIVGHTGPRSVRVTH